MGLPMGFLMQNAKIVPGLAPATKAAQADADAKTKSYAATIRETENKLKVEAEEKLKAQAKVESETAARLEAQKLASEEAKERA